MSLLEQSMQSVSDGDKRKFLSVGSHASIFISSLIVSIGIPIAIFSISDDPVVKDNAKEAMNFHLNVWFYGAILAFLSLISFGLLGFILAPIWLIYHWGLSIWAVFHCFKNPETPFRYPLIFRLV